MSTLDLTEDRLMRAAVYVGNGRIEIQSVPVPGIGAGELLVRVECCGICNTDLKKIEHNLLTPPRIFGHESAGVVVATGEGVTKFKPGDRVVAFHHVPCRACFYCDRKLYAQCEGYKRVGITAGYEPAGGGFAQYIRVMDWIVREGVERIPDGVSFEAASFVEPVNTCHKAVVAMDPQPGDVVLIQGQGPIGLIFTMLVARTGATIVATDTMPERPALASSLAYRPSLIVLDEPFGEPLREPGAEDRRRLGGRDCRSGDGGIAPRQPDSPVRADRGDGADRAFRRGDL